MEFNLESLSKKFSNFALLNLYIDEKTTNQEFVDLYKKHIENHNNHILNDPFPNSGFDIFIPKNEVFDNGIHAKMINMKIKAEMLIGGKSSSPFLIYPRSSISKTPLMLANHTGIIDSGYRGFLIGAFRSLDPSAPYTVEKHTRLLQICHPSLCPILVKIVKEEELSETLRGEGGFGSTGIIG